MLNDLISLRLVVLYLGEKSQYGWWQSDFFNRTSENFLKPIFPKSVLLAKYSGALAATSKVHEEHIGLGNVIHLFHVPEHVEQRIHQQMKEYGREPFHIIDSIEDALGFLKDLVKEQSTKAHSGPILLDTIHNNEINQKHIERMAAAYLSAFESDTKTFPYIRVENP